MIKESNKNRWLYVYYAILLIILVSWTDVNSVPPMPIRFGFLLALSVPLFAFRPTWAPVVLTLFLTVAQNSYSRSYMPANGLFYIIILLGIILVHSKKITHIKTQRVLIVLFLLAVITNLSSSSSEINYYYAIMMVFFFAYFVKKEDAIYPHFFSYAFILATLALCILYLRFGNDFSHEFDSDTERNYWQDPNYWGGVVGMGSLACFIELFTEKNRNRINTFLLIAVFLLSFLVLIINASRGAILAVLVGISVFILFSRRRNRLKVTVLLALIASVFAIYNSGLMDYFMYRISEGDTGRMDIWGTKINLFLQADPTHWIFGMGREAGAKLSRSGVYVSFHNDYLAYLVCYGLIGLIALLNYVFSPLKGKRNRIIVFALLTYLGVCLVTLEPLCTGHFPYFAFTFYAYVWSQSPEMTKSNSIFNEH